MRAFRYHAAAPATMARVEEVAVPEPAPGELLVRVRKASLNPVDWKIATGSFRILVRGGLPRTMGSDFSGEVAAVGAGVSGWTPGDPVLGFIDPFARPLGTFAEFVPVPVEFVTRRPPSMDDALGAALPCVGITAVTLCDLARVGRGASVLVNGASGGVGHLAVQVAKSRGALVAATASAGTPRVHYQTGGGYVHRLPRGATGSVADGFRRRARLRAEPATPQPSSLAPARRPLREHATDGLDLHA